MKQKDYATVETNAKRSWGTWTRVFTYFPRAALRKSPGETLDLGEMGWKSDSGFRGYDIQRHSWTNAKKTWAKVYILSYGAMRVVFGVAWFLAGLTKITKLGWFSKPGVFLVVYFVEALENANVPEFYRLFLGKLALKHVLFFNYTIPIAEMFVGVFLIIGFMILPSILACLFMHINFILSGNMNIVSLVLYTSAFGLLLGRGKIYIFSCDRYFGFIFPHPQADPSRSSSSFATRARASLRQRRNE